MHKSKANKMNNDERKMYVAAGTGDVATLHRYLQMPQVHIDSLNPDDVRVNLAEALGAVFLPAFFQLSLLGYVACSTLVV